MSRLPILVPWCSKHSHLEKEAHWRGLKFDFLRGLMTFSCSCSPPRRTQARKIHAFKGGKLQGSVKMLCFVEVSIIYGT